MVPLLLLCLGVGSAGHGQVTDPLEPAGTGGVAAVERALARLAVHKRLLVVAAHPDDEDTALLSLVSRGLGGEAAYLSLSRGEGGQNLIGDELGVGLGLLRSRELMAARRLDGARQYFSRAYDFGYTRSLEETFERWPREVLEEDVARVMRRFRPQVVVSIFPGQPSPTHGQHQAAGVVAHAVFDTVGEAGAFPELTAQGLPPWRPRALYRSTWFDPDATTLTLPNGRVDPLTGRSIFQTAMASRSRHRSQDMGMLQPLGGSASRLEWIRGVAKPPEGAEDVFAGIDTHLPAMADGLPEGSTRRLIRVALERVEATALAARDALPVTNPAAAAPAFRRILGDLGAVVNLLEQLHRDAPAGDPPAAEARAVQRLVEEKQTLAREGLAAAVGLAVDAVTARPYVVPGEAVPVEVQLWNTGGERDVEVTAVEILTPTGWRAVETEPEEPSEFDRRRFGPRETVGLGSVTPGALASFAFAVTAAPDAAPSRPYFLRAPLDGDLYDWSGVAPELRGEPFDPALLTARLTVRLGTTTFPVEREVTHRYQDQARGEERRPLRVLPALEVAAAPRLTLWSVADDAPTPGRIEVTLTRRGADSTNPVTGRVTVTAPDGWLTPPVPFEIPAGRVEETVVLPVTPPGDLAPGRYRLDVAAVTGDGHRYDLGLPLVSYEHIRPTPLPRPAVVEVSAVDLELPDLDRVAYVRGASDRVPEMLAQVGVPVTVLDADALRLQDLSVYDAVVVGSRAYEIDPALLSAHPRLLDYAEGGGLLIVQYQQYQFTRGGYPPFPLEISRPHDRVTDETAAVTLLVPDHPAFHRPNELGPADWDDWVQERGLYFAGTWDDAYTPLLAMADPGGDPLEGSLLVAPLGEGTYVYTGLAFFRQLPAGVPGAYRLFANLLGLAEATTATGRTR